MIETRLAQPRVSYQPFFKLELMLKRFKKFQSRSWQHAVGFISNKKYIIEEQLLQGTKLQHSMIWSTKVSQYNFIKKS